VTLRLSNGRMRGHHSLSKATAVGLFLASVFFIFLILIGRY
jgi:hypothetical protein